MTLTRFRLLIGPLALLASVVHFGSAAAAAPRFAPTLAPQSIDAGSTGADGVFNPQAIVVVDLATEGTYDPVHWRVVFHYQSVNIPSGVRVRFANHPSGAPVVWLSETDVVIEGVVDLNGGNGNGASLTYAEPGPGGFRGAVGQAPSSQVLASSRFGPGGGRRATGPNNVQFGVGGSFGSLGSAFSAGNGFPGPVYGHPTLQQLIGGSGGSAAFRDTGVNVGTGGAGGGAILIAANDSIQVTGGYIQAIGGTYGAPAGSYYPGGSGSGGGIRLVAGTVSFDAAAEVLATGGPPLFSAYRAGGNGRIRIEGNQLNLVPQTTPPASLGSPGLIAPTLGSPTADVVSIGGAAVPADPRAAFGSAMPDVSPATGPMTTVKIRTTNVPLNAAVYLRVTGATGPTFEALVTDGVTNPLTVTGGPGMEATTSLDVDLREGYSVLQARVIYP